MTVLNAILHVEPDAHGLVLLEFEGLELLFKARHEGFRSLRFFLHVHRARDPQSRAEGL
jgi:hypothetical protein